MKETQRPVSIAYVGGEADGFAAQISHLHEHKWKLHRCRTRTEAVRYVEAIWPDIRWCNFAEWMRETRGGRYTH